LLIGANAERFTIKELKAQALSDSWQTNELLPCPTQTYAAQEKIEKLLFMRIFPRHTHLYLLIVAYIVVFLAPPRATAQIGASTDAAQSDNKSAVRLSCKPCDLRFGGVAVSQTKTFSVTMTNGGPAVQTISAVSRSAAEFNVAGLKLPLTVRAGQSAHFDVRFTPAVAKHFDGQFKFWVLGSKLPVYVLAHGTGVAPHGVVTASPSSLGFGSVQIGNNAQRTIALTNPTKTTVTVSKVAVTGTGFSVTGIALPLTLTAGQSFTFTSIFAPTAAGNFAGNLSVTADASHLVVPVSGTGSAAGVLTISPATLPFGAVNVGTKKSLTASLSASGTAVKVNSATLSSSEFVLSGVSFPFTVPAGKAASITLTFDPVSAGSASAKLIFASNASDSSITQTLSGTGQASGAHRVSLSWNESSSSIAGYNVYRGSKTGGPYAKVNSSLDSATVYVDSGVTSGQTYFYVTTAVGTDGIESGYSNQVQAAVP
jgi:Abnormal spindle-like microcephaly-assoc'd, ASPM-SPD-2-Hydin